MGCVGRRRFISRHAPPLVRFAAECGGGQIAGFLATRVSPPAWERGVSNYFDTPLESYTQADLCTRYATFRQHALDRYKQEDRIMKQVSAQVGTHDRTTTSPLPTDYVHGLLLEIAANAPFPAATKPSTRTF